MTIFDLTRPLSRLPGSPGQVVSETTGRKIMISAKRSPLVRTLSYWALMLSVSLLMVSGCGRYKEELESAKQQIEKLTSDVNKLTEENTRLTKEKSSLSEASKILTDKNTRTQVELDHLNKSHTALSVENKELKKKAGMSENETASLKRENVYLTQEVNELKKRLDLITPPTKSTPLMGKEAGSPISKPDQELTPCDQVIAFMKSSEGIVRNQKGEERAKSLEQLRREYAPKMEGAPVRAIKTAEEWVKEGEKWWDKSDGDSARLLELRNAALKACGRSPKGGGF